MSVKSPEKKKLRSGKYDPFSDEVIEWGPWRDRVAFHAMCACLCMHVRTHIIV